MQTKPTIAGFESMQIYVYGKDLRRIRYLNNISLRTACLRMNSSGYAYYPNKLLRYERMSTVYFLPNELVLLVSAIGGTLNVVNNS